MSHFEEYLMREREKACRAFFYEIEPLREAQIKAMNRCLKGITYDPTSKSVTIKYPKEIEEFCASIDRLIEQRRLKMEEDFRRRFFPYTQKEELSWTLDSWKPAIRPPN